MDNLTYLSELSLFFPPHNCINDGIRPHNVAMEVTLRFSELIKMKFEEVSISSRYVSVTLILL